MDPTTQIILNGVSDLGHRLEAVAATIEARAERQVRSEEQFRAALDTLREKISDFRGELKNVVQLILGDGKEVGLKNQFDAMTRRMDDLEDAARTLDSGSRLRNLEYEVETIKKDMVESKDLALIDRRGQWDMLLESRKGKIAIVGFIIGSLAAIADIAINIIKYFSGVKP